jgi:hypothetical protein
MNIFWLDNHPQTSARYHCNTHVVKMCTEYAQILSTAYKINANVNLKELGFMAPTHEKHPSVLWAAESRQNWYDLYNLWVCLMDEYRYRYDRVYTHWRWASKLAEIEEEAYHTGKLEWPALHNTPLKLAMPDVFKQDDPVLAYRSYYIWNKCKLLKYRRRPVPEWILKYPMLTLVKEFYADGALNLSAFLKIADGNLSHANHLLQEWDTQIAMEMVQHIGKHMHK